MQALRPLLVLLALLASVAVTRARAAEAYDSCTGYIDSLPASISTQGTWCLRKHLFTSMTSGAAITLLTDNVTIDCNHFRISGFGAGVGTSTQGIAAGGSRQNATIRQCRIQGFKYGVALNGAGHLVEDNRFDGNTYVGIRVNGDNHTVRGNIVHDTGGWPESSSAIGIVAITGPATVGIRILDNTVDGVSPVENGLGDAFPIGIQGDGMILVQRNRISGLMTGADLWGAIGISLYGWAIVRDNELMQNPAVSGTGILTSGAATNICRENDIQGYSTPIGSCTLAGNNALQP